MDEQTILKILERVHAGEIAIEEALSELKGWPQGQCKFANLDHNRELRTGIPEVIFGENKSAEQIVGIARSMLCGTSVVMATRVAEEKAKVVCAALPELEYHQQARMIGGN
nr:1-(5-phosphoribosyl)-5-amino-4-imidazole-carboxylate carboxylase [Desulfobulbaceae bacterium]